MIHLCDLWNGFSSWEVDALRPDVLNNLLESAIRENIDFDKYQSILDAEKQDIIKLNGLTQYL